MCLEFALFLVEVSLTLKGQEVFTTFVDLDILEYNLPFFVATASLVLMCVTNLHQISKNVSTGFFNQGVVEWSHNDSLLKGGDVFVMGLESHREQIK